MAMAARTLGQTKTTPFYLILSTPVAKSSACGPQSRQKKDFYTEFCLLPHPNPPHADPKVDKKRTLYRILSTPASKSANRDPESRQKQRLSPNFCLLPRLNPARAGSKVEQIFPKLKKCSTADSKSGRHLQFRLPRPNPHTAPQSANRVRHPPS